MRCYKFRVNDIDTFDGICVIPRWNLIEDGVRRREQNSDDSIMIRFRQLSRQRLGRAKNTRNGLHFLTNPSKVHANQVWDQGGIFSSSLLRLSRELRNHFRERDRENECKSKVQNPIEERGNGCFSKVTNLKVKRKTLEQIGFKIFLSNNFWR